MLLLDEPCSALDPISTAKIEELIHELKNDYTVVIVTHNMQQAARVSDYTAYMYLGELIEFGETDQIFIKPKKQADRGLHHRPVRLEGLLDSATLTRPLTPTERSRSTAPWRASAPSRTPPRRLRQGGVAAFGAEPARSAKVRGPLHLSTGQEAVAAGVCANLRRDDY